MPFAALWSGESVIGWAVTFDCFELAFAARAKCSLHPVAAILMLVTTLTTLVQSIPIYTANKQYPLLVFDYCILILTSLILIQTMIRFASGGFRSPVARPALGGS